MKTVVKRSTLLEDTYKEKTRQEFENKIKEYVSLLSDLTTVDLASLPNREYYDLLTRFYNVTIEKEDYLNDFSRHFNMNYDRFGIINTDMILTTKTQDGFGNIVAWSEKKQKISVEAAISSGVNINPKKEYTNDELTSMINKRQIVVIGVNKTEVPKKTEVVEAYEPISVVDISKPDNEFFNKNLPLFGKMLKDTITKEKLNEDLLAFMRELNFQLRTVTIFNNGEYHDINKDCKIWWNASKEKETYDGIQERVTK